VTSLTQLYDFEKQLETSGTRHDMLREVWTHTYNEFINAKNNNSIIHYWDLKWWAIKNEISLQNFSVSNIWIWKFKRYYRIVSWKITKFVTRNYFREKDDKISTANMFVNSTKLFLQNFSDNQYTIQINLGSTRKFTLDVRLIIEVLGISKQLHNLHQQLLIHILFSQQFQKMANFYHLFLLYFKNRLVVLIPE
jgi:hypothetical protein